jgi:hypothetical protein
MKVMDNILVQYMIGLALTVYPTWKIIKRTGLNQYWAALLFIPGLGGLIVLVMLAFSDWPINSEGGV